MPPFTTVNGQTGYYMNGQFVPATQQEYDAQFNAPTQGFNNPFIQMNPLLGPMNQRQQPVQQGQIVAPSMSNEQKVMNSQGSDVINMDNNLNLPFGMQENGILGFQNKYGQSFNSNAMTASGHPIIQRQPQVNPIWNYNDQKQAILMQEMNQNSQMSSNPFINNNANGLNQSLNISDAGNASSQGAGAGLNSLNSSVSGLEGLGEGGLGELGEGGLGMGGGGFNSKEFFSSGKGQSASAIAGAGIGMATNLIKAGAPDKYDQRVGMSKPNLAGNLLGDSTFTQVGFNPALMAATGGISAVVGGSVDLIKNAAKYVKQKDRYENKKLGVNTMQSIEDSRENMKPDYTGYARFGAEVKNPYLKQYNNGGPVNPKKKEQERFVKEKGWPMPTAQDSLYASQRSKELINYYKNSMGNDLKEILGKNLSLNNQAQSLDDNNEWFKNESGYSMVPDMFGGEYSVEKPKKDIEYRKKQTKPWIVEQRESATGVLDTRAPFGYYDLRIAPHGSAVGGNNNPGPMHADIVDMPIYDYRALKPYAMRTPEDHEYLSKTYGTETSNTSTVPQMEYKDTVAGQLESIGIKPTFENRKKMAEEYGITGYSGTMNQNMKLLDLVKSGAQKQVPIPQMVLPNPVANPVADPVYNQESVIPASQESASPIPKMSAEDIQMLNNIQNMGLRRSGQWLDMTDEDKLNAYKRGSKFEPMPQQDSRGAGYYKFGGPVNPYIV